MQSLNKGFHCNKKKNLTHEQIIQLQLELKNYGIDDRSYTELILGLPEETKETTLILLEHL